MLLSALKAEVHELTQNERDFRELTAQLKNLEHRYALLQSDKARNETQAKAQLEAQMQREANLKTDVDTLQSLLMEKNAENH